MTKTFTTRSNAIRAARAELGNPTAMDLVQFKVTEADGAFSYTLLDNTAVISPPKVGNGQKAREPAVAEKASKPKRATKAHTAADKAEPRVLAHETVLVLLKRPQGATVAEIAEKMGWLPHTTRAFLSTQAKKRGWDVKTTKSPDGRVYQVAA